MAKLLSRDAILDLLEALKVSLSLFILDMIRTVVWFGVGGLFTACYANLVRGLPMWRSKCRCIFFVVVSSPSTWTVLYVGQYYCDSIL